MKRVLIFYASLIRALVRRLIAGEPRGYCVSCQSSVLAFLPYQGGSAAIPEAMRTIDVVGSDVDHFSCPKCWAHDRERHLLLYFEKLDFNSLITRRRVLHFAPEPSIKRFIESAAPAKYIRGDLFPANDEIQRLNLCDMPFENASFDVVIANHVLEHVDDDRRALNEICRVLSPGGVAVLQTPFAAKLAKTICDPEITEPKLRLQLYGQADHVRLYGIDIFQTISSAGLPSEVRQHSELLSEIDYRIFGVNPKEPLMLFRKPLC